jgi:hypothetical protein
MMSLDISLVKKDGTEVMSMNWLRNPFGLCQWAEDNAHYAGLKPRKRLWYVCNNWNYKNSRRINRPLFRDVVYEYANKLMELSRGYYFFDLPSYRQFIEPHKDFLPWEAGAFFGNPWITGSKYDDRKRLMVPVEHFAMHGCFALPDVSLGYYKKWYDDLIEFAELLQDKTFKFHCSN